jgi:hypothetical protein
MGKSKGTVCWQPACSRSLAEEGGEVRQICPRSPDPARRTGKQQRQRSLPQLESRGAFHSHRSKSLTTKFWVGSNSGDSSNAVPVAIGAPMSDQATLQSIARQLERNRFDDLEGQLTMLEGSLMRVEARLHRLVAELHGATVTMKS